MRTIRADIWSLEKSHWIVIPTNIGWKRDGTAVLGAGLAKQAAERYPDLPAWYGAWCRRLRDVMPVLEYARLILFPTKPLDPNNPHLSWRNKASLELIERSAGQLAKWEFGDDSEVAVPLVGCGLGGLPEDAVIPVLEKHLSSDRFVLVRP